MGQAASPSLYDYAHGDPVNFLDPTGRIFGTPLTLGEYASAVGSGFHEGIMVISDTLNPTKLVGRQYAGLYADSGDYDPSDPAAQLSRRVVVGTVSAAVTVPLSVVGGEALLGLYNAGQLGTGAVGSTILLVTNGAMNAGISVASNAATQQITTGTINTGQLATAGLVGLGFGGVSGGLSLWSNSIEAASEASIAQIESQAAFASSTGRYLDITEQEIDAAIAQASVRVGQIGSAAAIQSGTIFGLDTFGSPVMEDYVESKIEALLGFELPEKSTSNSNGNGCSK